MRESPVLLLLAVLLMLAGCTKSNCANEAIAKCSSPDGQWKYVSFDRNCGATTGNNLQISILPASESQPSSAANAFIADDNHGATQFLAQPEWSSRQKLRIAYSKKARIFKKESKVGPIEIEYFEQP